MPYCTQADLLEIALSEEELLQLTDDEGIETVNTVRVTAAIDAADQLIDGHLRGRYPLPLTVVPTLIRKISIDLTVYHLYQRRKRDAMPESMQAQYKNALKLLEQVQKGTLLLGIEATGSDESPQAQNSYRTNKTAADREFSKDVLKSY